MVPRTKIFATRRSTKKKKKKKKSSNNIYYITSLVPWVPEDGVRCIEGTLPMMRSAVHEAMFYTIVVQNI